MSALTDTQKRDVAILASQGDTAEQIAANLDVAEAEVKKALPAKRTTTKPKGETATEV